MMVKNIVARRERRSTASVLRSSKTLIREGDEPVGRGGTSDEGRGGGVDDEPDAVSSLLVAEDAEFEVTSSTRTMMRGVRLFTYLFRSRGEEEEEEGREEEEEYGSEYVIHCIRQQVSMRGVFLWR